MNTLELGLVKSIHDPIHGTIKLSNEEMEIIEHPLFSRLHHIRQNSFLYKVFPCAKHTRFEHSIGVMHLASKMLVAVLENGSVASLRKDIANDKLFKELYDKTDGVGIDLYEISKNNNNNGLLGKAFRQLRFAALLHDIGHGPLSHLFDSFAPSVDEFKKIVSADNDLVSNDKIYKAIIRMIDNYKEKKVKKEIPEEKIRVEHEHVSCYFAYRVLKKIGIEESEIENVLTILNPSLELGELKIDIYGEKFNLLKLLNDLVASAPIDCDRMDYLKRDSYFAGVPYGNYSEERVLKSMLAYVNKDNDIRLGLKNSGLHAIENFLQARYELYVQVYGHKTNEACRAMLDFVCEGNLPFNSWANINFNNNEKLHEEFESLYISLDDVSFLNCIIEAVDKDEQDQFAKERASTLEKLRNRKLWKRIYEVEEFISEKNQETKVSKIFRDGYRKMKDKYAEVRIFEGERFPLKDISGDKGAKLLEKSLHSVYTVSNIELTKASQIINSLNNGLRVLRIYSVNKVGSDSLKSYAKDNIHMLINETKMG